MTLAKVGEILFMNCDLADVIFKVEDVEFPGHRLVLSVVCPYFNELFNKEKIKYPNNVVQITDTSAKMFKEIFRYAYVGRLEISDWSLEDKISLLSVAHDYQYNEVISEVVLSLEIQYLDFDSHKVLHFWASKYDLNTLIAKCVSFAEEKLVDFSNQRDLSKFTPEFICFMFDSPKALELNQDKLLNAIFEWKTYNSTGEIMSIFKKIQWDKVSSNLMASIVQEYFEIVNNVDGLESWKEVSLNEEEPKTPTNSLKAMLYIDKIGLIYDQECIFDCDRFHCSFNCTLFTGDIVFQLKRRGSWFEVPIKSIEWESPDKHKIEDVICKRLDMSVVSSKVMWESTSDSSWRKFTILLDPEAMIYMINIRLSQFENQEIELRNITIY